MGKTAGRVLKAEDVKLEGLFHLDLIQADLSIPRGKKAAVAAPTARVVESRPEFVVVEITCSCGAKTQLKCEYAGADASAGQVPDNTK